MPRRARPEISDRHHERRRAVRARRRQTAKRILGRSILVYEAEKHRFRRIFPRKLEQTHPPSLIDKAIEAITYPIRLELIKWERQYRRWLEELKMPLTQRLRHELYKMSRIETEGYDRLTYLWDLVRGRAIPVFKVEYTYLKPETWSLEVLDRRLREEPVEVIYDVVSDLLRIARLGVRAEVIREKDALRHYLYSLVPFFREEPCTHGSFSFKLTPVTFSITQGRFVTFYVLRWGRVKSIRADPYIGVTRPVMFKFFSYVYKPDYEWFNAMMMAGYGTLRADKLIVIGRDQNYAVLLRSKPYSVLAFPHRVTDALAMELGQREVNVELRHCSVYISPRRMYEHYEAIESGMPFTVFGVNPMGKVKTEDFTAGVRGL